MSNNDTQGTLTAQRRNALASLPQGSFDPEGPLLIFSSDPALWTPANLRHAQHRPAALALLLRGGIPAIRFCRLDKTNSGSYRPGAGCIVTFKELGEQIIPRFWSLLEEQPELAWDVDPYEASHAR
ncbi:MAG: hypothetical protein M3Z18_00980 [Gemmatimonadota bacterium]|nr:hypothetical protein [Gemmatimonadota bacterium]